MKRELNKTLLMKGYQNKQILRIGKIDHVFHQLQIVSHHYTMHNMLNFLRLSDSFCTSALQSVNDNSNSKKRLKLNKSLLIKVLSQLINFDFKRIKLRDFIIFEAFENPY